MSREKKAREHRGFSREGTEAFSEVSAFLGGIFFTSLLILFQQRDNFDVALIEVNLKEFFQIRITQLHTIGIPLSISVVLFVFSSVFFAAACNQKKQSELDEYADDALTVFVLGLLSMFASLFIILILVDIFVSVLGIILSIGTFIWWTRRRAENKSA